MKRLSVLTFGILCYAVFFATFLYNIGFLSNSYVPKTIDSGHEGPWLIAVATNLVLLIVFALQHNGLAE